MSMAPILLGLLIFGFLYNQYPQFNEKESVQQEIRKLVQLHYVDDKSLPSKSDSITINEWLDQLDPHTYYLEPKNAQRNKNQLDGIRVGIGVQLQFKGDTPIIIYVVPNSPAAKAGVLPGDRIIEVNEISIKQIAASDTSVIERVLGLENSSVTIRFYNAHFDRTHSKTLTRSNMSFSSTSQIFLTSQKVGYAQFNLFTNNSHEELIDSLKSLKSQGMKYLILDLRGNGGGVLSEAVSIANEFLPRNKLITYTKGLRRDKETFKANGDGQFIKLPMIILSDQQSASASEILSAALQDNDRVKIVGEHTFGKGLVQETYVLSNRGSLNMTISRYYTPKNKSIQRAYPYIEGDSNYGVRPDFSVIATKNIYPTTEHFIWATDIALYQQNWKEKYPTSAQFANSVVNHSDSFLFYTALGAVIYGPSELPNFVLRKDAVFIAARQLLLNKN